MTDHPEATANGADAASRDAARWELRTIAKGGGIAYGGRLADQAISAVTGILFASCLGSAGYGLFSLGRTAARLLALVCSLGMVQTVARFMSVASGRGDEGAAGKAVVDGAAIAGAGTVLAAAGLALFAEDIAAVGFGKPELAPVLRIAALSAPLLGVAPVLASAARVRGSIIPRAVGELSGRLVMVAVLVWVWWQGLGVTAVMWGFVVGAALYLGLTTALVRRICPGLLSSTPRSRARPGSLLSYGLPISLGDLADTGLIPCAILILGARNTNAETGVFTVAMLLSLGAQYPILGLGELFDPVIARLHAAGDRQRLRRLTHTVTKWAAAISLPLIVILVAQRDGIMGVLGPDFAGSGRALACMAVAILLWVASGPANLLLVMTGRQWYDFGNRAAAAGVNIGLCWMWAVDHGAVGASGALAIGFGVLSALRMAQVWIMLRLPPYDLRILKPIAAALVCSVPLWLWTPAGIAPLVGLVLGYLVLFAAAYWACGLDSDDRDVVAAIKERLSGG